jgi:hypothetical protein
MGSKPGATGSIKSQQETSISPLVLQLSSGSLLSGPSSSESTDPSVSFNFVCPDPRSAHASDSMLHTAACPRAGDAMESSSQQLSLWANKRESRMTSASSSSRGKTSKGKPRYLAARSPRPSLAAGVAWRAMPARNGIVPETRIPVVGARRRTGCPATRAHHGPHVTVYTAGSRLDLPFNKRLHSSAHVSPVTSSTCSSSSVLHSRSSALTHQPRHHSKPHSQTRHTQRHAPRSRHLSHKQRPLQPKLTCQTDLKSFTNQNGAMRSGGAAPSRLVNGSSSCSVQQMQELNRLLHQVIQLHTGEASSGPLAAASVFPDTFALLSMASFSI